MAVRNPPTRSRSHGDRGMSGKLKVLSLFAGIGAIDLGLERTGGFETIAVSEIDPYAAAVLAKRFPNAVNIGDITKAEFPNADVVAAGFPCQDLSNAGKRAGLAGDRSGLWREVMRAVRVVRPRFVLLENVAALLNRGVGKVLGDLAADGLNAEWDCIPASHVGAPHNRDRWFALAYPERGERWTEPYCGALGRMGREQQSFPWDRSWESALREFRGMDDGAAYRVDRVDTIRNAVVPQIITEIGHCVLQGIDRQSLAT